MAANFRNKKNIRPLIDGEVLVSFAENPKISPEGVFSEDWFTVGILSEDSRVEITRTIERTQIKGFGYGTVAVSAKPGDLTATCDVLEENETVDRIKWANRKVEDGLVAEGKAEILYHDANTARPFVAFVERFDDGKVRITASRYKSYATIEGLGFGAEVEATQIQFEFTTGANKDAFDRIFINDSNVAANEDQIIRFNADAPQPDSEEDTEAPDES